MEKESRRFIKENPCLAGERKDFRRLKTNSLSGFHLFSGLAQLSFNQRPLSLRSRLNTFGLPLRSVMYITPSMPLSFECSQDCILLVIFKSTSAIYQVFFFFLVSCKYSKCNYRKVLESSTPPWRDGTVQNNLAKYNHIKKNYSTK